MALTATNLPHPFRFRFERQTLRTLDPKRRLEGVPLLPGVVQFCSTRFSVFKSPSPHDLPGRLLIKKEAGVSISYSVTSLPLPRKTPRGIRR